MIWQKYTNIRLKIKQEIWPQILEYLSCWRIFLVAELDFSCADLFLAYRGREFIFLIEV